MSRDGPGPRAESVPTRRRRCGCQCRETATCLHDLRGVRDHFCEAKRDERVGAPPLKPGVITFITFASISPVAGTSGLEVTLKLADAILQISNNLGRSAQCLWTGFS